MRTFTLLAAAAAATIVLPAVPGLVSASDGTSLAVRRADPVVAGLHSRGPVTDVRAPASTSKSATPHPRLSLMAAARRSEDIGPSRSTGTGARGNGSAKRAVANTLTPADAIGWCESRNRYDAENPTSTASGRWQFIASTWRAVTGLNPPASAWPPSVQRSAFLTLWDNGRGAHHWAPSRDCWAPLLDGGAP